MTSAIILALIAGYVDTVGYLHFNAFAGLMTGNTIFLGIEFATEKYDKAIFHGVIILAFLVGVIVARVKMRAGLNSWIALSAASAMLVICSFSERTVAAILLSLAMGIQNSAANRFNGVALNTVFITGNLQKLGEELVTWIWPSKDEPPARVLRSSHSYGSVTRWEPRQARSPQFHGKAALRSGCHPAIHHASTTPGRPRVR